MRDAVLRRLDQLDSVAGNADAHTLLPLARTEINRLADGWRLLLTVPERDPRAALAVPGLADGTRATDRRRRAAPATDPPAA